jgi:hypothetical protein
LAIPRLTGSGRAPSRLLQNSGIPLIPPFKEWMRADRPPDVNTANNEKKRAQPLT